MGKKVIHLFPFAVYYKHVSQFDTPGVSVAFAIPKKRFKHAVDRNRIKRLCREAYRLNKHQLLVQLPSPQTKLLLFFMFNGKEMPDFKLVEVRFKALFPQIIAAISSSNKAEA
jgi:ribonuclease P protein component